jgi:hypothetical protein
MMYRVVCNVRRDVDVRVDACSACLTLLTFTASSLCIGLCVAIFVK